MFHTLAHIEKIQVSQSFFVYYRLALYHEPGEHRRLCDLRTSVQL